MRHGTLKDLLILGGLCLILLSCKSNRAITKQVPSRSINEVLDTLASKKKTYDFLFAKARIKFNDQESKIGGRMTVMMVPDSVIWMNFKKISIEGARTLIRPDSMWILYRFDDLYEADYTQAYLDFYKIDMSFHQLQEFMIGNVTIPKPQDIDLYQETSEYLIEFDDIQGRYRYKLDIDMNLSYIEIKDIQGRTFAMRISEYDDDGFGRRRDIQITDVDSTHSQIAMKFSNVTFDERKPIKFVIPDHYRKLP